MEPYQILFWVFSAIATGGTCLGIAAAIKLELPTWLRAAHGLAGLFSLGAFFLVNLQFAIGATPWWSLGVLLAALIGGLIFFRVLFPKQAPLWLIAGHGSIAAIGIYLLYQTAY